MNRTVSLVREAVKHGKCVVIGLQSTGEAGTVDQLEKNNGELDEFVSTARYELIAPVFSIAKKNKQTGKPLKNILVYEKKSKKADSVF